MAEKPPEIEVTPEMVNRAWRVLMNWGGLRNRNLDQQAITKTMLMAALGEISDD